MNSKKRRIVVNIPGLWNVKVGFGMGLIGIGALILRFPDILQYALALLLIVAGVGLTVSGVRNRSAVSTRTPKQGDVEVME
ncbi:MAG TPA: hypothetical protein EYN79_10035 [Planctomycetes bacterium]|nr:hypothetical protein [Planctomycetota bacterium]HIN80408.1 hypothetical protein [Planctomycetota bacterium]